MCACTYVCVSVCLGAGDSRTCGQNGDATSVQLQEDEAGGACRRNWGKEVVELKKSGLVQTGRVKS